MDFQIFSDRFLTDICIWQFSDRILTHLRQFSDRFLQLTVFWQISDRYLTDFQKFPYLHWTWVPKSQPLISCLNVGGNSVQDVSSGFTPQNGAGIHINCHQSCWTTLHSNLFQMPNALLGCPSLAVPSRVIAHSSCSPSSPAAAVQFFPSCKLGSDGSIRILYLSLHTLGLKHDLTYELFCSKF